MAAALTAALRDCGTSSDNPDTCAVCKLHFDECEMDVHTYDEAPPYLTFPACPGARARTLLASLG